jgi:serine O-acetyltransferase
MKKFFKKIFYVFNLLRFSPLVLIYYLHPLHQSFYNEGKYWNKIIKNIEGFELIDFIWFLRFLPEYRSVFYHRIGRKGKKLFSFFLRERESLFINMPQQNIGTGFVLQHGFATIIGAVRIGNNCQIWHNVTIGTNISHSGNRPTIGNNVKVCTGTIILGKVTIGNNVTIGAGTIIVKDVPDNCTVVGNPATIIKKDGVSVSIKL